MRTTTCSLLVAASLLLSGTAAHAAGELARSVRSKISAGDLASAEAIVEDYGRDTGKDAEYLAGLAWTARGAFVLGRHDRALELVREVRALIPESKPENLIALGAAIEVEGQILATRQGKDAALRFYEQERKWSDDAAFQSRIWKNVNYLSLEGQKAPEIVAADQLGPAWPGFEALRGKSVVLFLWAQWCGDCKAQAATLARIRARYEPQGVFFAAPTRFYGTGKDGVAATPAEEKAVVAAVLAETYQAVGPLSVPISTEAMIRYGGSATPSFIFIDDEGVVRAYTATRLTEADLARHIDELLARRKARS